MKDSSKWLSLWGVYTCTCTWQARLFIGAWQNLHSLTLFSIENPLKALKLGISITNNFFTNTEITKNNLFVDIDKITTLLVTDIWKCEGMTDIYYRKWSSNEPNNYGSGEDCAVIRNVSDEWNDVPCHHEYLAVCMKPVSPMLHF